MKAIIGLGNPGRRYQGSRHNVGFEVIDKLAKAHQIKLKSLHKIVRIGEGFIGVKPLILVKPLTYVNVSGLAVAHMLQNYGVPIEDLVVICDDLNLALGRLRISRKGSHGGHKGLKSIIAVLCSGEFPRIRIGIGKPAGTGDLTDWVLSRFTEVEWPIIQQAIGLAAEAVEMIIEVGLDGAMNRFNRPPAVAEN